MPKSDQENSFVTDSFLACCGLEFKEFQTKLYSSKSLLARIQ